MSAGRGLACGCTGSCPHSEYPTSGRVQSLPCGATWRHEPHVYPDGKTDVDYECPGVEGRVRSWSIQGECGVALTVERQHMPSLESPMPPHVCYRAAYNVGCVVTAIQTVMEEL